MTVSTVRERFAWMLLAVGLVVGFWVGNSWAGEVSWADQLNAATERAPEVEWSWAQQLSGRTAEKAPEVERVSDIWLRDHACAGRACRVLGWYSDGVVYLDRRLDVSDLYAASILVHELVHSLQGEAGRYGGCQHAMALEREAYDVQTRYLLANGSLAAVIAGASMHGAGCEY
jgi:hypothetical protein